MLGRLALPRLAPERKLEPVLKLERWGLAAGRANERVEVWPAELLEKAEGGALARVGEAMETPL